MSLNDDTWVIAGPVLLAFVAILVGIFWNLWQLPSGSAFAEYEKEFKAYEDGKHRRYELLFAVNGGAFALARLFPEQDHGQWLARLSLDDLALGMIVFTVIMVFDIVTFGTGMRNLARSTTWTLWTGIFSLIGLLVLFVLCLLICAAWYLSRPSLPPWSISVVVILLLVSTLIYIYRDRRAQVDARPQATDPKQSAQPDGSTQQCGALPNDSA
jgi:hypothetical protein